MIARSSPAASLVASGIIALLAATAFAQSKPAKPASVPPKRPAAASESGEFDRIVKQAGAAREAGKIDESIGLYQKAVRLRPKWTEGYWHLGTAFYQLDRHADARDAFARVVRDEPKHGSAFGFKGLCEFQLKNYEAALHDLLRATDLGVVGPPDVLAAVQYHLAIVFTRLEQYDFAMETLQGFAHEGNDSPRVIEAFGMALLRIPMVPSELPAQRREMVMLAGRGAYYQAARVATAARPAFELLAQRYSDVPNVHYAYGMYLLGEDPDRAIDEFKKELAAYAAHLPSILQIAFEYLKRSDWEAARPWAQKAVELDARSFAARRALGQVLFETGDTTGAIEHLELGKKLAPDSPSMRFMLSRAYQKAGREADAERERAEFLRLERLVRSRKHGTSSVGGETVPPGVE